jgi:hypothetical protein
VAVSQGSERLRVARNSLREQISNLIHKTGIEHPNDPSLDLTVTLGTRRIDANRTDLKTLQWTPRLRLEMLRQRLAGFESNLEGSNDFGRVSNCNATRRDRIEPSQQSMQMIRTSSLDNGSQTRSHRSRSRGAGKQSFDESSQIQTRSSNKNRDALPLTNIGEYLPRFTLVIPCSEQFGRLPYINHVMGNTLPLFEGRLCASDIETAEDLDGIEIDDLAVETLCNGKRQL